MTRKVILIIEDNAVNMKLARLVLEHGDYTVLEAADAEKGIEIAREHQPDLVLMDIQLPGMDGLDATRAMKADPELKGITVVALTSFAMDGDAEKALEAGCAGYLTKPINTRTFLGDVARYIVL